MDNRISQTMDEDTGTLVLLTEAVGAIMVLIIFS